MKPPYRSNAPRTSRQAAEHMVDKAPTQRERVLEYVHGCGERGATAWEVEVALQMRSSSVNPRMWELRKLARIVPTERRRPTESGCDAVVHVAAEYAKN
jgi:hypothetical protein